MTVLGIETSGAVGSVAVVKEGWCLGEVVIGRPKEHSLRLLAAIDALLGLLGLKGEDLEGISVGLGPGSFTGLRVGLSAAKGLAMALDLPLVGIPSYDALAMQIPIEGLLVILGDAKGGLLYMGLYEDGEPLAPLEATDPKGVLEALRGKGGTIVGDAVSLYPELREGLRRFRFLTGPFHPRASTVALMGERRLSRGERDDLPSLTPLYLRPSDAELAKEKKGR